MNNELTDNLLEGARERHARLYAKLLENPSKQEIVFGSEQEREKFIADANDFLQDLKKVAPKVNLLSDYTWLVNTSLQWQVAFLTLLNIQKRVEIPTPPLGLRVAQEDLSDRLNEVARIIWYFRFMDEVKSHLDSGDDEKKKADWLHAKIYVAGEVLSGGRVSVDRLSSNSYRELETVWLRDVIQLKAYLIWQERGAQRERSAEGRRGDYLDACEFYRRRLADQEIKQEPEKFTIIGDYLKSKYCDAQGEKLDERKAKELIEIKAKQYSIIRSQKNIYNDKRNWYDAENYVRAFYNYIIPAVMEADAESIECIRKAISWSEGEESRSSIMNALEAAICIYFVKNIEYSSIRWRY